MATLEAVVTELKELNDFSDLQVEAQLELSDLQRETVSVQKRQLNQLVDLEQVMRDFMNLVPEQIVSGFADLIASNESIASNAEKAAATRERIKERDGDDEDKPTKEKPGFIAGNFKKGMEDFEKEGFGGLGVFKGLKDTIADIIQTIGIFSAAAGKGFALLKGGIVALTGAITLPMVLIAGAITAIVSGIFSFIDDFKSQEGSLFDKIVAGLGGFIDGFLKILTIPLDWIKSLISTALGFFGFDGAEQVLDSFSFTDLIDGLTDSLVDFIIGLKDMIMDGIKGIGKSIMGFFGFGDDELEEAVPEVKPEKRKRGREISSPTDDVNLSEEGQAAVDDLKGSGVPEVDPETGKRGREIGTKYGSTTTETRADGTTVTTERKPNAMGQAAIGAANEIKKKQQLDKMNNERMQQGLPLLEKLPSADDLQEVKVTAKPIIVPAPTPPAPAPAPAVVSEAPAPAPVKVDVAAPLTKTPKLASQEERAALLDEGRSLNDEIEKLRAVLAEMGEARSAENIAKFKEGLDVTTDEGKAEAKKRFDDFQGERKKITDQIKALKKEADSKFAELDAAMGGTPEKEARFAAMEEGRDDFDTTDTIDEFLERRGTPTKVKRTVTETGGGVTERKVSDEQLAKDRRDAEMSRARSQAEGDAFNMLTEQGIVGADEFLMGDDPRMKQLMDLADKLMEERGFGAPIKKALGVAQDIKEVVQGEVQPEVVGSAQEAQLRDGRLSAEQQKMDATQAQQAEAASNVVVAPTDNRTSVSNTTVNSVPIPSPMDKSDRTSRGAYRGRKI